MATLVARPHPLRSDCYSADIADGASLLDTLGDLPGNVFAQIDGEVLTREQWADAVPSDATVTVYANPEDDAGRAIALIAVAVLSYFTGGAAATAYGGATTVAGAAAGAAASAAVTIAGNLAVNALIPPKLPSTPDSTSSTVRQSVTGTRNSPDPYGVVPRVYGNPRWYPKLAAHPITEIAGNDQYMRMMLVLGYGPLEIDGNRVGPGLPVLNQDTDVGNAITIAETNINEYEDVEYEIGMPDQLDLAYPDIAEESIGVALNRVGDLNDDVWVPDGNNATRTTAPGTREISIDLVAPNGLFSINDNGSTSATRVEFMVEYRESGELEWQVQDASWIINGPTKETMRLNRRWKVPVGQYDVRVTRVASYHGGTEAVYSDFSWGVLRSIQEGPAYTGNHVIMAVRIRATDQLNGVIDQLGVKTQAVVRVYDGFTFNLEATSNPAWAYLDALTGAQVGNPVGDGQIDIVAIREWAVWCESQSLHYHWVHDSSETVLERARVIATAGEASFALQDGLFGVVRDDPDEPLVQAITPRNATGFSCTRNFEDLPHALRVKYIDPDTWSDAERIIYRDGYDETNATRFEDFETQGVADADEAWHHGMYYMRQAILRRESYRVSMDWENLAVMRGNRARLAYDAIKVGLGWGRVKSVVGQVITLDEDVEWETSQPYGIRVRGYNGPQATTPVTAEAIGPTNTLTMSESILVNEGDLVMYGPLGRESIDCKVTVVEPGEDYTADLTLVPAATDIYDFSSAPIFDPGITNPIPADRIRPPIPQITSVRGGEDAAHQNPDGSFQTLIRVAYGFTTQIGLPGLEVEARYRIVGTDQWLRAGPYAASGNLTIRDVEDEENYEIQIQARNGAMVSGWSQMVSLTATGQQVTAPTRVDVEIGTFTLVLYPRGIYPNAQYEFFRSQAPLALPDVETAATRLGIGSVWSDTDLVPDTTYYYYVRGWSANFVSAFVAVEATTDNNPEAILRNITGQIDETVLAQDLKEEIDKIPVIEADVTRVEEKVNIELGETSLVRDGSFDLDLNEWDILTGGSLLTIVRRDENVAGVVANMPSEYAARMQDGLVALTQAPRASVKAGDLFTAQVDVAVLSGGSVPFLFGIEWSDQDGNVIENTVLVDETITSSTWETLGPITVTVPAGVVKGRISVIRQSGAGTLFVTNIRAYRADKVLVERIDTIQAVADDNAATIQTVEQASIDADEALGSRIDTVQATADGNTATIQQETQARVAGDEANAQLITDVQTSLDGVEDSLAAVEITAETTSKLVTDTEGGNLIMNGSLRTGDDTGWRSVNSNGVTINPTIERPSGSGRFASTYMFVATPGNRTIATSNEFAVREGEKITATYDYATGGSSPVCNSRLYFRYGKADGSLVTNDFGPVVSHSGQWQRYDAYVSTVPVGAVYAYVGLNLPAGNENDAFITNLSAHHVDVILAAQYMVKLQAGGLVGGFGLYNDGATVDAGFDVDRFWIGRTNNDRVKPFIVANGQVLIDEALIGTATITNAKIANLAVDTAKIANGAIETAKIANAAITTAKIDNLAVTNAKIANLAVDTIKIADQAVTIPASSYAGGTATVNDGWTSVQSVDINPQGNPVDITVTCTLFGLISTTATVNSVAVNARLLLNGSELVNYGTIYRDRSYSQSGAVSAPDIYFAETAAFGYRTGALSGNQTFTLQLHRDLQASASGTVTASKRFIKVAGVRK